MNLQTILNTIKNVFTVDLQTPANLLPAIIMACSLIKRPGISCMLSTSNIIQNMSKKGIPIEKLPDGTPNLMNLMVNSVVCELVRTLKEDANIQIAIEPGSITFNGTGGNAGGPVTVVGTNINFAKGVGVLQ